MESLAFVHSAVAYENPEPDPEIRVNGVAAQAALVGLVSLGAAVTVTTTADSAQAIMYPGDRGTGVTQLQSALGVGADGIYGPITTSAVTSYQRSRGLAVDGIAGPATLSSLGLPSNLGPGGSAPGGGGPGPGGSATVTAGSGLNVRSSPGGTVIGGLAYGTTVGLTGSTSGGWCGISSPISGYVACSYLTAGGGGPGPGSGYYVATNGSSLTIRSGPGTGYAAIGSLANGSSLSVVSSSGGWYQLASGGWVSSAWVASY